jgi:hypothetical protein
MKLEQAVLPNPCLEEEEEEEEEEEVVCLGISCNYSVWGIFSMWELVHVSSMSYQFWYSCPENPCGL